ncbi:hypothetical protein COCSUDRAFT_83592 [Coccomyxa subellipsoidea C-169]|uniref:ARM repeat-containing protein n=1 Tax=Coccomyxa subellipsoidea (strain C-169) TaxID=574566 RepID=I0YLH5_COCSC|nr:hypothetical protein COCSUDRAFT_83592 [Coccomyxa subellipsoidea C-169]EIE19244.1 hypothetical protein COCSUDRAFT_83592 [Coccomyxa subellipsoidea C-169]|eukprot:XP_005643788.1 hypothetical protein COCSUDRAFT_83592 [Coccomyxa subellipsoidea C-169]
MVSHLDISHPPQDTDAAIPSPAAQASWGPSHSEVCAEVAALSGWLLCRAAAPQDEAINALERGAGHRGADQSGLNPKGPQFEVELRAVPAAAENGEVLKADGQLSDDEDAALTRTIAALVLNLRGIDPEIREDCKDKVREVAGEGLMRLVRFLDPMYSDRGERLRSKAATALAHLATDNEANAQAILKLGGVEALTAVMGAESEPVLACAAMQALTTLAGHASARLAVLRDSSLLPNLTQRLGPGVDEGVMEAALWLFSTAVQGDSSAQKQGLSALPDLVRLLDKGASSTVTAAAAAALTSLVAGNAQAQAAAHNVGALPELIRLLELAMPETGSLTEGAVLPVAAERAVWAVAELAAGCPANQDAVRELHGIAPLVWLLDGPADSMITIGAAGALCNLAESNPENQSAITCTAALDAFPRLLREGLASHSFIVEVVAWCMQHLAQGSPEARDAMREAGALPVLVSVLDSADPQSARAAWAVSALAADCPANRAAFRDAGALPRLVRMLSSGDESGLTAAAVWALLQLAGDCPENKKAIAAAGAVPTFVRLLQSKNELVAEGASEAMLHIVTPSQQQEGAPAQAAGHAALRAAGAIPTLLNLVEGSPDKASAVTALGTLQNLAAESAANKDAIREAGGIPVLINLVEAAPETQAADVAVEALANLMASCTANREAVRAAGGVPVLVRLLGAGPWKDITERATSAIAELVHTCPQNQTQGAIISEGGVEALVRLLEGGPVSAGTAAAVWALMELCVRNPGGQHALMHHGGLEKAAGIPVSHRTTLGTFAAAAWALFAATQSNTETRDAAFAAGALEPLLLLVEGSGAQAAVEGALSSLANLADGCPEVRRSAGEAGAIELLVTCLQSAQNGKGTLRMTELAAHALRTLAFDDVANQDAARAAGALHLLTAQLRSVGTTAQRGKERQARRENAILAAVRAVHALARSNVANQDELLAEGAVQELVACLVRSGDKPVAEYAASALLVLSHNHPGVKAAVAASGGIAALVALIARRPADDRAAEPAAGALANLAHDSPGNAAAIAAAGGVPPLVALLGAPAERKTPEWAALTIQYTAQHHRPSQASFKKVGAVPALTKLVGYGPGSAAAAAAARALLVLAYDYEKLLHWL